MGIGFGSNNPMPFKLGGGQSIVEVERTTLLGALSKVIDIGETTEYYHEAHAEAVALSSVWRCNGRLRNQALPTRMLENLPVWEEAMSLRPSDADHDNDRRGKVAAKMRGVANNALSDMEAACRSILGANFVALRLRDPANDITYWPGVNPGTPGFEWSSNRARFAVEMTSSALSNPNLLIKRDAVVEYLDSNAPVWMNFQVGIGSGFTINQGIVGQTIVG